MGDAIFGTLMAVVVSVILLIPFGLASLFLFVSLRQLMIGSQERAAFKIKGSLLPLVLSFIVWLVILFVLLWIWIL
ncbi:hypothetical protein [Paraflavitalea pollutisoli]|uniref:hypothetical protein n=1 Tax=Paraflavitalea pollutisoli TaxID=3034143 RepID=UPI0023ED20A0|nr:hypothetical protein [Paraflavitalea sp. H1-2-19X]